MTSVQVEAVGGTGGQGGACVGSSAAGGSGAALTATLKVGERETLHVHFGGGGEGGTGKCADGGTGGGASEVLSGSLSPLLVAGGGGGGGGVFEEIEGGSGGVGGSAQAGKLTGGNGSSGRLSPEYGGGFGEGASELSVGKGGAASTEIECEAGADGSAGTGGSGGGVFEGRCEAGGGGGGGYRGGGGGGGGYLDGGGGGAGSSYIDTALASGNVAVNTSEPQEVVITYTVPQTCTSVSGQGAYKKVREVGRLKLEDNLSTNLEASQMLHVKYESGKVHFRLIKLEKASCTGEVGERDFHGEGAAAVGKKTGYTLSFSIYEKAGGFFFESKLMKGAEVVEASGGPLKKSTEEIEPNPHLTSVSPEEACPHSIVTFTGTGLGPVGTTFDAQWTAPEGREASTQATITVENTHATAEVPLLAAPEATTVGTVAIDHSNALAFRYTGVSVCEAK